MKAAIYARYSSDLQRDASIEDQIRVCRERAEKDGWSIVGCYTDHAISGATMLRPGIQQLMQDAAQGKFDIVATEALDRLSRDQENVAGLFKRLSFCGVRIITLSEGEISHLHIGLKGTMNALYLKDMAEKVRRGQRGRVEQGKVGGGLCYGYDVVRAYDERGEPIRGEREINPDHAPVVLRIFEEYADGKSPKAIAHGLNADGVPGPTGNGWTASTLNGNWRRGSGILNNDLYNGEMVWNRVSYPKNPDTGKHVTRNNPPEEWVRTKVPELRIVPQDLWERAKKRQLNSRQDHKKFWEKQRPKYLFSFLLKCGECGGGMAKISHAAYGCSTARNKGKAVCDNRRTVRQDMLEYTVLKLIQQNLMAPDLLKEFCDEYTAHLNRLRIDRNSSLAGYRSELERIAQRDRRIVQAIMDGYASESLKQEMNALVARKAELEALIESTDEAPVLLHPNMAERYRQEVSKLIEALRDDKHRHEAVELLRSLIDRIVLVPNPNGPGLLIDLHGDLAGILNVACRGLSAKTQQEVDLRRIRLVAGLDKQATTGRQDKMVGPAGFEPATRPL